MGQGDRSGGEAKRAANEARQEERRLNKKGRPMRRGERSGVEAKKKITMNRDKMRAPFY